MPQLSISRDGGRPFLDLLDRPEVLLGRSEDAQIHLSGLGVSREHAAVRLAADGLSWVLVDLSVTGTLLNGQRIEPEKEVPLRDGDKITIGPNIAIFQAALVNAGVATQTLRSPRGAGRLVKMEGESLHLEHGELLVLEGPDKGKSHRIAGSSAEVGHAQGCHFRLTDLTVSKKHLRIDATATGFTVFDLDTTNGTYVHGKQIKKLDLVKDTQITLGKTVLQFGVKPQTQKLVAPSAAFNAMAGEGAAMQRVFDSIEKLAGYECPVLILGETGTGKELAARAIHARSHRALKPMVTADCTWLDSEVVNSELFGHEKGAFTGATERTDGLFRKANGGTLFLDEVGELPAQTQAKLLRVLQNGEVRRLGGTHDETVDVRILAATHRDLQDKVKKGEFREDLYYRLKVAVLKLPPLRERMEDIPALVDYLLARMSQPGNPPLSITPAAMDRLAEFHWPGNVRELEHRLQRAVISAGGRTIDEADVRLDAKEDVSGARPEPTREEIVEALKKYRKVSRAAVALGRSRPALYRRMEALGIKRDPDGRVS